MLKRSGIIVVLLIATLLLSSPFFLGMWFQKQYSTLISSYNTQGIHAKIIHYQRGWMSSEATLSVEVTHSNWKDFFALLGVEEDSLPETFSFNLEQHIQHGPVFYRHTTNLPSIFGLALIKNKIHFSPEFQTLFAKVGITNDFLRDEDLVTFRGNYFKHFQISNWHLNYPEDGVLFRWGGVEGGVWILPKKNRFTGELKFKDVLLADTENYFSIANIALQIDQYQESHGLWLGTYALSVPKMLFQNEQGDHAAISDFKFTGVADEKSGLLNATRGVSIDQIEFNDEVVGPLNLQLSARKLNAQAIADMIQTYKDTMQHGELYQSQLQQKIASLLPNIVTPGTTIQLDDLNVTAASGQAHMNGEIFWPEANFIAPDNVPEIINLAHLRLQLRISKKLLNDAIQFSAGLPYFIRYFAASDQAALMDARDQMDTAIKQNAFLLTELVQQQVLSEQMGMQLLTMQKKLVPIESYFSTIREWFLTKQISREVSYLLYWQYVRVQQPYLFLEEKVNEYQQAALQQLQAQLKDFINKGYVKEDKNDYSVSLTRSQEKMAVNGRAIE